MMKRLVIILSLLILSLLFLASCEHSHEFGEWETVTEPTCAEAGIKKRTCECGETQSEKIATLDHEIQFINPIDPTCSVDGATNGTYCKKCGSFIKAPDVIPAEHKYRTHIETYPSCVSQGINVYTCTVCYSSKAESIEALGHNWKEATCTAPSRCERCLAENSLPLGHTVAYGHCDRCSNFVTPTAVVPELPLSVSNGVLFCETDMRIDEITASFSVNSVTFTFSGQKTTDKKTLEGGKYFCGFSYKLYDKSNYLVASGQYTISELSVGDRFTDKTLTIDITTEMSTHYTLVIDDYMP